MKIFLKLLIILIFVTTSFTIESQATECKKLPKLGNISPQTNASNATQDNTDSQPCLTEDSLGILPAIIFDGADDFLNYNGKALINEPGYTIFVVEKRTSNKDNNYFLGTTSNSSPTNNSGLILGYKTNTQIVFGQGSNQEVIAIEPYSSKQPTILHTFSHSASSGKKYYRNGAIVYQNAANKDSLELNDDASIGRNGDDYFNGIIGELIVYERLLSLDELDAIHKYLIDKWGTIDEIKRGTGCDIDSPGYISITDGHWPNNNTAIDGESISIICDIGSVQGVVNNLTCSNGVYSGGGGGGFCGTSFLDCDDLDINTNFKLYGGGTWDSTHVDHGDTTPFTCPLGNNGSDPVLTCNDGILERTGGNCFAQCPPYTARLDWYSNSAGYSYMPLSNPGQCRTTTGWSGSAHANYCCGDGRWSFLASNFLKVSPGGAVTSVFHAHGNIFNASSCNSVYYSYCNVP